MSNPGYDVIVVGAGVAGAASAIKLGMEGYRVLLLDRAVFPRHKTCGEGIMPEGVRILASLGVLPAVLEQAGPPIRGLRFRSQAGVWAQADFPPVGGEPSYSAVIRRYELDHILVRRAGSLDSVTVREGFVVREALFEGGAIQGVAGHPTGQAGRREEIRAPLTLAADGMHSHFHNRYGITRESRRRKRWGITGHLAGVRDLRPYIEVLYQGDSEIYLAPLAGDTALVAVLLEKEGMAAFRSDLAGAYHRFLQESPGFGPRVEDTEVIPPVGALGPMGYTVEPIYLAGLLLLGDSAGFIDAITGEGMTLALKSVEAAMPVIREAFAAGDFGADLLAQYAVERARLVDDVARLTQLMLEVTRSSLLSNRAIQRLSKDEQLFQKLMGIVTGTSSFGDFTLKDRLALAMG